MGGNQMACQESKGRGEHEEENGGRKKKTSRREG